MRQITLPAGTFKEIRPNVWKQISGECIIKKIEKDFNAGKMNK